MMIGPNLDGEGDEPLSREQIDKLFRKHYASEEKRRIELGKAMVQFWIAREKSLKEKRKPLGMPDDKPKRSSPKSED